MKTFHLAGACCIALAIAFGSASVHAAHAPLSADEIALAIKGAICTTKAGARFTFSGDGHYTYDGLWQSRGHYTIGHGMITVTFDSGLERSFAMSRRDGVLYMEQTGLSCGPGGTTVDAAKQP